MDLELGVASLEADIDKLDIVVRPGSDRILSRAKGDLGAGLHAAQDLEDRLIGRVWLAHLRATLITARFAVSKYNYR